MNIWILNYKERQVQRQGFIEASTLEKAIELGHTYCDSNLNRRFIGVTDAMLAREIPVVEESARKKAS